MLAAACAWAVLLGSVDRAHAFRTLAERDGSPEPYRWDGPGRVGLAPETARSADASSVAALLRRELAFALATWNDVRCARRLLESVGREDDAPPTIRIHVVSGWVDAGFDADAAGTTEVVLESRVDGTSAIVGADVYLNGDFTWGGHPHPAVEGVRDLRAVLVHELGHALGLAHNCEVAVADLACSPGTEAATMYPIYSGASQAVLAADDVEGICTLYPPRPSPSLACEAHRDCMEAERCEDGRCAPDARYGVGCRSSTDCPSDVCVAVAGGDAPGVCSHACTSDDECPSGAACAPVEASADHVCAPLGEAATTCAVSTPAPHLRSVGSTLPFALVASLILARRFRASGTRLGTAASKE